MEESPDNTAPRGECRRREGRKKAETGTVATTKESLQPQVTGRQQQLATRCFTRANVLQEVLPTIPIKCEEKHENGS